MALTLNDMIAMIQFRLGKRSDLASEIEREIVFAQTRLEKSPVLEPWFLVSEETLAATPGTTLVTIPTGFLRESEEKQMQVLVEGIEIPMERISADDAASRYQGVTGVPVSYVLSGTELRVYPEPDVAYTLRWTVALKEVELTTDATTPVLTNAWVEEAYALLLNKALIPLAQSLGNKRVLENATADFQTAFGELQVESVQREDSNQTSQRAKSSGDHLG